MDGQNNAHPFSGEIMTRRIAGGDPASRCGSTDVVDAEFETVRVDPASAMLLAVHTPNIPSGRSGMESLAPSRAAPVRLFSMRGGIGFWTAGAALISAAFWISGGHAMLLSLSRTAGQTAPPVITIADVVSRVDSSGARAVIFVDGSLENDGTAPARLPALEIRVTGSDGLVTRYKLGTSSRALDPAGRYAFSSRLDAPRNGVRTVAVTFAE